jgi:hypothetical protein
MTSSAACGDATDKQSVEVNAKIAVNVIFSISGPFCFWRAYATKFHAGPFGCMADVGWPSWLVVSDEETRIGLSKQKQGPTE